MTKEQRRAKAENWFSVNGINPNTPDRDGNSGLLDLRPSLQYTANDGGVISHPCTISVEGFLFYAHVTVTFNDGTNAYEFEGGSGGVGVGDLTSGGIIYYGNQNTLLTATTFGVAFGAEDGGVCQVTWGTSGNATAAGIGEGLGAFGGSGRWTTV